jgi:hypothetical protein
VESGKRCFRFESDLMKLGFNRERVGGTKRLFGGFVLPESIKPLSSEQEEVGFVRLA